MYNIVHLRSLRNTCAKIRIARSAALRMQQQYTASLIAASINH